MFESPHRNQKQEPSLDLQAKGEEIRTEHYSSPPSEDPSTWSDTICTWCDRMELGSDRCRVGSVWTDEPLYRRVFHGDCDYFLENDLLPRSTCGFCRHLQHYSKYASSPKGHDEKLAIYARSFWYCKEDVLNECQFCVLAETLFRHEDISHVVLAVNRTELGSGELYVRSRPRDESLFDYGTIFHLPISTHPWPQISAKADWDRIRTWPLLASEQGEDLPNEFRVIDIMKNRIVCPDDPVHYVALSYVWGRTSRKELQATLGNIKRLEVEGSLSRIQLPRTIRDAMFTCRQLGQRYLWVDRLCILQDDKDSKHGQIARMDRIFGAAVFTIIALAGSDSQSGLAGVSRLRHTLPKRVEWPDFNLIQPVLLKDLVADSTWNKRGWTFQEEFCSGSSSYFTDYGVYHSLYQPNRDSWEIRSECYSNPKMGTSGDPIIIFTLIEEYTKRSFSFQDDILRAFTGVLNMLHGDKHHFGVPVAHFTRGIHWHPLDWTCQKRVSLTEIFPSWSWSSAQGPVKFRYFDKAVSLWALPAVPEPGKNEELQWISHNYHAAHLKSLTIDAGIIGAPDFLFNIELENSDLPLSPSTLSVFEGRDRKRAHESPGRLLSFTQVATFSIQNLYYHCSDGHRTFSIRSVQNEHVGDIELTASSSEELKGDNGLLREEPFEFLALGYGCELFYLKKLRDDLSPKRDESLSKQNRALADYRFQLSYLEAQNKARLLACRYGMEYKPGMSCHDSVNVMLILRDEVSGVARRVGIGKVLKEGWLEARPELKTVVLE